ncbi:hypothetical protein [Oligoflexus tunisiensis]|uniref:hypothetical protein n=1 Tax=Oligoflexus tunisiensis TaxID=708132 RepID=UPI00114CB09F|nr:hypothetical protein [Oligoflexus tunisiensis]
MTKALQKAIMGLLLATHLFNSSQVHAQDIPVEGASFFDHMQNIIGTNYDGKPLPQKPHPFEALLKKLNQHSSFFTSVVPFGRSLQKMAAYPQSLKFPRVLVATSELSKSMNTHFRGRLFIAYVEATKKLEVISFNPMMGRYEFQIVDNFYPGGKAQARYVPRSLCLRCHQGGTPIFAGGEWLETTAFNSELQKLSIAAIGSKEYFGIPLTRDDPSSKYELLPRPENFEDMVRFGALLVGYQKAWQDICSLTRHKLECKKKLIRWMLVTNLYDKLSLEPDLELLRGFVSVLGDGTIDLASEKLPDHNPVVKGQLSYHMPPEMDPSLPRERMKIIMPSKSDPLGLQFYKFHILVKGMGQSFFTEKDFDHFRSLLGGKPEPRSAPQRDTARTCLPDPADLLQSLNSKGDSKQHMQLNCFPKDKWLRFAKAIDALPLTQNDPLSRESILQALDKKLGTQYAASLCCQTNLALAAKKEIEKKIFLDPSSIKDQRLQSFLKFCSECHLYQDLPPPFLAGENEAQVLENIKKRADLIQFRLQNKQMPPHFARHQLSEKERQDLLQDLKNISK